MTVGEVRRALQKLPDGAALVAYADWEGEGERPLGLLEERLYICGYFVVEEAECEQAEQVTRGVLILGRKCF